MDLGKRVISVCIDSAPNMKMKMFSLSHLQFIDLSKAKDDSDIESIMLNTLNPILRPEENTTLTEAQRQSNLEAAEERRNGPQDYIPNKINVDVFISYRRLDGRDYARNIMQGLRIMGYPNIFFDYHSLDDGVFNTQIIDAIYSCKDFILVISPLALKNCSREGDWVAKEIRTALKYGKKIIPVVIEDTFKDWPQDFPKDMAKIKSIQFHKLMTDEYFEDSIYKLSNRLSTIATEVASISGLNKSQNVEMPPKETHMYKIKVNRRCRLIIDETETQILEASKLTKIPLTEGEYIRKVVDIEDDSNFDEIHLVMDHDKVDIISLEPSKPKGFFRQLFSKS